MENAIDRLRERAHTDTREIRPAPTKDFHTGHDVVIRSNLCGSPPQYSEWCQLGWFGTKEAALDAIAKAEGGE